MLIRPSLSPPNPRTDSSAQGMGDPTSTQHHLPERGVLQILALGPFDLHAKSKAP